MPHERHYFRIQGTLTKLRPDKLENQFHRLSTFRDVSMQTLYKIITCFTLLISVTAQSEVHFVYPKSSDMVIDSDTIIHPKNLKKYSTFKIETRQSTDTLGNQVELVYILEFCKEPLFMWKTCKIFGPIPREKMDAYLAHVAPERQDILADLESVDKFYDRSEGLSLGAINLTMMIPGVQLAAVVPLAIQKNRLARLTKKVKPLALVYESQNRNVYFAINPLTENLDLSTRLQTEVEEILNRDF